MRKGRGLNNIKNFTNTSSSGDSNTSQSSEVSQAGRSIQRSPFSSGVNNISQTFNIKSEPMVGTAIQDSSGKIIGYYNNMNTNELYLKKTLIGQSLEQTI